MSVNKLYVCAVDDNDVIKRVLAIAKTSGGEFYCYENTEKDLNKFLLDAFIDGYGIAFKDDGDLVSPSFYLFPSKKKDNRIANYAFIYIDDELDMRSISDYVILVGLSW